MSAEQKDYLAKITPTLALLIALAAIAVPYFQQSKQFDQQQRESINIVLNSAVDGPLLLTDHNLGVKWKVVQMPWQITVSNTGHKQLSIIKKLISSGKEPGYRYYSGIDGGIFTLEYEPIKLPIKLEPGESKSYYIYIGAIVPKKSYDILNNLSKSGSVMDNDAMKSLGEEGIDLFGNPVRIQASENDQFIIDFSSKESSPTFWVELSTGNGNKFYGKAAKYEL